jgi:hypothetical protein
MGSKLKNIKAIGEMLQGTHRTQTKQTHGWADVDSVAEKNKKRSIGDVWIEKHPITGIEYEWEQKDGYRTKRPLNLGKNVDEIRNYLRTFQNCPKEVCTCVTPTNLDERFKKLMGMCHDCVVTMETQLKIKGKFNEYALDKIKNNAEVFIRQTDQEVAQLKRELSQPINFVEGADGRTETWNLDNPEFLINQIDEQYTDFKTKLYDKINKEMSHF